jgi:hypothetical protein
MMYQNILTTKYTKGTKDPDNINLNFVFFASFVVKRAFTLCLARFAPCASHPDLVRRHRAVSKRGEIVTYGDFLGNRPVTW